jgi:hypothetical protein
MKFTSSLISAGSGKLGGAVFSHGRNGQIMRRHAIPTQPRTNAQKAVRNQLAALSSAFRNLGATTIAGWNALASGVTRKSKLGTTYHPTGQQLYVSCGKNLAAIGIAIGNMAAPTIPTIPALPSFSITAPSPGATVTTLPLVFGAALASNFGIVLKATSVQSAGRTFVGKSAFRSVGANAVASALTADLYGYFIARFGPLPQAGTIQAEVKYIDPASGFAGPPVTANVAFSQPVGTDLFTIAPASPTKSVVKGSTVTDLITITDNGTFSGAVNLSCSGLPANVTYTFGAPATGNPAAASSTLSLITTSSATPGVYPITVIGAYGSFQATTTVTLTITAV